MINPLFVLMTASARKIFAMMLVAVLTVLAKIFVVVKALKLHSQIFLSCFVFAVQRH